VSNLGRSSTSSVSIEEAIASSGVRLHGTMAPRGVKDLVQHIARVTPRPTIRCESLRLWSTFQSIAVRYERLRVSAEKLFVGPVRFITVVERLLAGNHG